LDQKDARDYTVLDVRKALKLTSEELEKKENSKKTF
jgi:hypothetical protein